MTNNNFCKVDGCLKLKDKSQGSSMCSMHRVRWSRHKSHNLPKKELLPDGIEKICKKHGELKRDEVYLNGLNAQYQCRHCKKDSYLKFKKNNPNRNSNNLKNNWYVGKADKKIKVPKEHYDKLYINQNGLCAICKCIETTLSPDRKNIKRLAIDHCHTSAKIRGLLCQKCNQGLGNFKDSIELLNSAINYLNASI